MPTQYLIPKELECTHADGQGSVLGAVGLAKGVNLVENALRVLSGLRTRAAKMGSEGNSTVQSAKRVALWGTLYLFRQYQEFHSWG